MSELRMPSLGADMDSGVLVRWHVKAGDAVKKGGVVAEVETQKGVFGVDIREDGVVEELLVAEGTRVPVGAPLARLRGGAAVSAPATAAPAARHRASPLARRIAAERGIDLATVHGTGTGGVITRVDVEHAPLLAPRAAAAPTVAPPPAPVPLPSATSTDRALAMRQAIGAAMSRSKREIPHYYMSQELDLSRATEWLRTANTSRELPKRLLPAALLLKAVARALGEYGEFNGHWIDGAFRPSEAVHLGVAIALRGGGLVAPALHDASQLSIDQMMGGLLDLVERARTGKLRTSEFTDATVTVTSLGDAGAQAVFGVIYPPQVAIIGFGGIADRPWAADGMLGVRRTVTATLAADHRASDGHRGALLLGALQRLLLEPEAL